jgi:hypothetical protein
MARVLRKAEPLFRRALGRYSEAEPVFRRALAIQEKAPSY